MFQSVNKLPERIQGQFNYTLEYTEEFYPKLDRIATQFFINQSDIILLSNKKSRTFESYVISIIKAQHFIKAFKYDKT